MFIKKTYLEYPNSVGVESQIIRYQLSWLPRIAINYIKHNVEHAHSHPWNFFSIILWGGYYETIYKNGILNTKWRGIGSIAYRNYNQVHNIDLNGGKAITLFIRGKQKKKSTKILEGNCLVTDTKFFLSKGYSKDEIRNYLNKLN